VRGLAVKLSATVKATATMAGRTSKEEAGYIGNGRREIQKTRTITPINITIPTCLHRNFLIKEEKVMEVWATATAESPATPVTPKLTASITQQEGTVTGAPAFIDIDIPSTNYQTIPTGTYMIDSNVEFFKYGFSIVRATTVNIDT
jgi:hypothetical protein